MSLPIQIMAALHRAMEAIDADITARREQKRGTADLNFLRNEVVEILEGRRTKASKEASHMIIDSMDWEQPCLKAFNEARELLGRYFRQREKLNLDLMNYFVNGMSKAFGAPPYLSRYLYTRWGFEEALFSKQEIDCFLNSKILHSAIFPHQRINILREYKEIELEAVGTRLQPLTEKEHHYTDTLLSYRWLQVYQGAGGIWLDLYKVIDPLIDESKIKKALIHCQRPGHQ